MAFGPVLKFIFMNLPGCEDCITLDLLSDLASGKCVSWDRLPQPHSHSPPQLLNPSHEHPSPVSPGQTDSFPIWQLAETFSPVYTALDLLRSVWVPHLWSFILSSWTGNAWPHKEHWCCQANFAREGGPQNAACESLLGEDHQLHSL